MSNYDGEATVLEYNSLHKPIKKQYEDVLLYEKALVLLKPGDQVCLRGKKISDDKSHNTKGFSG